MIIPSTLYQRFLQQSNKLMKVRGSTHLTEEIKELFLADPDVIERWSKTMYFYRNERRCLDQKCIEDELDQCLNALINDEDELMIGLDSISSLKDLLITSMRISIEENFQLEIRIGLGGTHQAITLRTPSYVIAGIRLLERLIQL